MIYFFDFDRTLCVHNYDGKAKGPSTYYNECMNVLDPKLFDREYGGDVAPEYMKWYVGRVRANDCNLVYVLTHEIFNLRDEYKKRFALENYGIRPDHYLSVNSADHKVPMMQAIAGMFEAEPEDCILVDDSVNTLYEAEQVGIRGMHISNVMVEYEKHMKEGVD